MDILLDTHVLLWAAGEPDRLTADARAYLEDPDNHLIFSAASLWEIAIKLMLGRPDFQADPALLRTELLRHGYEELPVTGTDAARLLSLPDIHKDPFDRMLVAQNLVRGSLLLTADENVLKYPGAIRSV